jgi:hypothetical protein
MQSDEPREVWRHPAHARKAEARQHFNNSAQIWLRTQRRAAPINPHAGSDPAAVIVWVLGAAVFWCLVCGITGAILANR